ncbi:MAG: hypothetical protein ACRCUH_05635 [Shewanella sp.]
MLKTHKMLTSGLFENVMLRSVTNTMQSFAFTIGFALSRGYVNAGKMVVACSRYPDVER